MCIHLHARYLVIPLKYGCGINIPGISISIFAPISIPGHLMTQFVSRQINVLRSFQHNSEKRSVAIAKAYFPIVVA